MQDTSNERPLPRKRSRLGCIHTRKGNPFMSQEYENGVLKAILERAVNRRRFLAGAGATAAAVGSPLLLSKVAEAANSTSAAPLDATLPPPITFPGNGIGASFGSYTPPTT